ncbi:MAG: PIN domain-containing protein [Candidatus Aminicenantes bacterium]|jgi:predicted nucleic acid-binding protein
MTDSLFVDSNIWLYSFIDSYQEKYEISKNLIKSKEEKIILSIQVVNEVCFNLLKKANFNESQIQELIDNFFNRYRFSRFDKDLLKKGSKLRERYSLSFWDSLILSAALFSNCHTIYSEDMQHNLLIENKLKIINPFK